MVSATRFHELLRTELYCAGVARPLSQRCLTSVANCISMLCEESCVVDFQLDGTTRFSTKSLVDKGPNGDPTRLELSDSLSIILTPRQYHASPDIDLGTLFPREEGYQRSNEIICERIVAELEAPAQSGTKLLSFRECDHVRLLRPLQAHLSTVVEPLLSSRFGKSDSLAALRAWIVVKHHSMKRPRIVDPSAAKGYLYDALSSAPEELPYTASILPTSLQSDALRNHFPNSAEDPVEIFTRPLGELSRAIADTSFLTGCIDVGTAHERNSPESRDAGDPRDLYDRQRRELESKFYVEACGFVESTTRIVYFPLSVQGANWLSLYIFDDPSRNPDGVEHRELLSYIAFEVVPRISERAQVAATESYLSLVEDLMLQALEQMNTPGSIQKLAQAFDDLARIYPYPVVELTQADSGFGFDFQLHPNPFFNTGIDSQIDTESMEARRSAAYATYKTSHTNVAIGEAEALAQEMWEDGETQASQCIYNLRDTYIRCSRDVDEYVSARKRLLSEYCKVMRTRQHGGQLNESIQPKEAVEDLWACGKPHLFCRTRSGAASLRLATGMLVIAWCCHHKDQSLKERDLLRLLDPIPEATTDDDEMHWLKRISNARKELACRGYLGQRATDNAEGLSLLYILSGSAGKGEGRRDFDEQELQVLERFASQVHKKRWIKTDSPLGKSNWPSFLRFRN